SSPSPGGPSAAGPGQRRRSVLSTSAPSASAKSRSGRGDAHSAARRPAGRRPFRLVQGGKKTRTKLARDVMTENPACCAPETPLDQVAKLMRQHDCGEIPVVDPGEQPIGVITDRDIVCRVVAEGKNPMAYPAEICMSQPVTT